MTDIWATRIDVREMSTQLDRCVSVPLGRVSPDSVSQLEESGYDQAPVSGVRGIVTTEHLQKLVRNDRPLEASDPEIRKSCVQASESLSNLLSAMCSESSVLVIVDGSNEGNIVGLLTTSDLNKHILRSALYSLLSGVETRLAQFIETNCSDPWDWIPLLAEEHQVQILGYWQFSQRNGVDIGPMAACTLTNLLKIVEKSKILRAKLGYRSSSDAANDFGRIPRLRNSVMHPVRPLIKSRDDVAELKDTLGHLAEMSQRLS
jgi:hypothetical protein